MLTWNKAGTGYEAFSPDGVRFRIVRTPGHRYRLTVNDTRAAVPDGKLSDLKTAADQLCRSFEEPAPGKCADGVVDAGKADPTDFDGPVSAGLGCPLCDGTGCGLCATPERQAARGILPEPAAGGVPMSPAVPSPGATDPPADPVGTFDDDGDEVSEPTPLAADDGDPPGEPVGRISRPTPRYVSGGPLAYHRDGRPVLSWLVR